MVRKEELARFDEALVDLDERPRNALLMRLELDLDYATIAGECGYPTPDAARMAVTRVLEQVIRRIADHGAPG